MVPRKTGRIVSPRRNDHSQTASVHQRTTLHETILHQRGRQVRSRQGCQTVTVQRSTAGLSADPTAKTLPSGRNTKLLDHFRSMSPEWLSIKILGHRAGLFHRRMMQPAVRQPRRLRHIRRHSGPGTLPTNSCPDQRRSGFYEVPPRDNGHQPERSMLAYRVSCQSA